MKIATTSRSPIYIARNEADSARHYFQKWEPYAKSLNDRHSWSLRMRDYYLMQGQKDSTIKYALQCYYQFDSLHTERSASNFQRFQAQNVYYRHQQNALKHQLESEHAKFQLLALAIISSVCLVLIFVGGVYAWRWGRKKFRHFQTMHEQDIQDMQEFKEKEALQRQTLSNYEVEKQRLKQQIDEHSHTIDQLHDEIQQKTNDLTQFATQLKEARQKESDAMELQQKLNQQQDTLNELQQKLGQHLKTIGDLKEKLNRQLKTVGELQQKVSEYQLSDEEVNAIQVFDQLCNEPPIKRLMELAKRYKTPSESEWKAAIDTVETYYQALKSIRFRKKVTDIEYRICVLTALKMAADDIALLTGMNGDTLSKKRGRMLKKIINHEGGAKEFDSYIQELCNTSVACASNSQAQ